jgi:hypothetical protein
LHADSRGRAPDLRHVSDRIGATRVSNPMYLHDDTPVNQSH